MERAGPTFSMICLWGIMEIVGSTNMTNNFHDSRNYGLGPRGFSKIVEIVGKTSIFPSFSMICLWGIMEIVGSTNISNTYHDSRNYGLGPRGFSKFMEIVGNVGRTSIFHDLFVGNHGNCWFYQHFQQFP